VRKALIVGINHYDHIAALSGCVNDAHAVRDVLARHEDGQTNFLAPKILVARDASEHVTRAQIRAAAKELFESDVDIALFYFAGHGHIEMTGGYLCGSDTRSGDDGLALSDLIEYAKRSPARNRVIILDSCYGGVAADRNGTPVAEIGHGMTVLTASTAGQAAMEVAGGGAGVFTRLFVDAMNGAAANLVGDITPGSVYAHIDQSLGPWGGQRPVFKTNVQEFVSLRKTAPPIELQTLRMLSTDFPADHARIELDPSFEPERSECEKKNPTMPLPDPANNVVFARLQAYVKVNLVRPIGARHMWHAAMVSQSCELTSLGRHYRRLVADGLI